MSTAPKFSLLKYLEKHAPVICDGGAWRNFQKAGQVYAEGHLFLANLANPELVVAAVKEYCQAGSKIIRTNTAGAQRFYLSELNLLDRIENINNNGMALIREATGMQALAAGHVRAIPLTQTEIFWPFFEQAYGEQVIYLSDTQANFLLLAGFNDLDSALCCLKVCKRAGLLEILLHWRWDGEMSSTQLIPIFHQLREAGANFLGLEVNTEQMSLGTINKMNSEVIKLVTELIEEFGVLSIELDDRHSGADGNVSGSFQEATRELLKTEIAMFWGGPHSTPAHIQFTNACLAQLLQDNEF